MTITRLKLEQFTAFESLDFGPSPGINVLVGTNGTGKTHIMKAIYAACDVSKTQGNFADKLVKVFLPYRGSLSRLVRRQSGGSGSKVTVSRGQRRLQISFDKPTERTAAKNIGGASAWMDDPVESTYIPVEETLANAPGFRSLYAQRDVHFEEIYADILDRAYKPALREPPSRDRRRLIAILRKAMEGSVIYSGEEFFLRNKHGRLEFSLLAEGIRKLGLLWLLIRNGTLPEGSVLFWDEPETNLNPKLFQSLIEILLELQRMGVQIFIATHDYVILKEFDLGLRNDDEITFHSLYRESESGEVACHSVRDYLNIRPNAIAETFTDFYDREMERSLSRIWRTLIEARSQARGRSPANAC